MMNLPSGSPFLAEKDMNAVFTKLSPDELRELLTKVRKTALARGLYYLQEGACEPIRLMLRPFLLRPVQHAYFRYVCLQVSEALKKLAHLYVRVPRIRELLPLEPEEEDFLFDVWSDAQDVHHTSISRLDGNARFEDPDWQESFVLYEPNSVGIGGLHYAPLSVILVEEIVVPILRRHAPGLLLDESDDLRDLFLKEISAHARALGRPGLRVAILDDPRYRDGIGEYPFLVDYLRERGLDVELADPRLLALAGGEVVYGGKPVDILYRDLDLRALLAMRKEGIDPTPIREAFARNLVVSSLDGEFDHKSAFDVLTDEDCQAYFSPEQTRLFRHHVLWTRLVFDRHTTDPSGRRVELGEYVRRHREWLVLKPNRSFGGSDVTIGPHATQAEWETSLDEAFRAPRTMVVQFYQPVGEAVFPIVDEQGGVEMRSLHTVGGYMATARGMGTIVRVSGDPVVNVSRGGGIAAVLLLMPGESA